MDRRDFLKASAAAGASAAIPGLAAGTSGTSGNFPRRTPTARKYWLWTGIDKKAPLSELRAKYARYKSHGIDGVFIGGGLDDREFDVAKAAGIEIHTWMWTTNRGDDWIRKNHPDWYMVSRSGKSCFDKPPYVDYYRWVSPVIPGVQSYLKEKVAELAAHPAVSGVHLDYVRYPDVILPRALWAKYGLDQTEELPDYDFCYGDHTRKAFLSATGRDLAEIKDPARDQQWLHFRYDSVTNLVKQLAKVAHDHRKLITAAVFPSPSQARKICRQDWDKWPLDAACPMTYHSFYNQPVSWIGDCVLENIQAATFPIYAGLYLPDLGNLDEFKKAIQVATHNGAAGVSLFGGLDDAHWDAFGRTISEIPRTIG